MNKFSRFFAKQKETTVFILLKQNDKQFAEGNSFPESFENLEFNIKYFYDIKDFQHYMCKHQSKIEQKYGKLFFIVHENKQFFAYDNDCTFIKKIEPEIENCLKLTKSIEFKTTFLGIFPQQVKNNFTILEYDSNSIEYVFANFRIKKERYITPKKIFFFTIIILCLAPLIGITYILMLYKTNDYQYIIFDIPFITLIAIFAMILGYYAANKEYEEYFITFNNDLLICGTPKKDEFYIHCRFIDQIEFYKKKITVTYHIESEFLKIGASKEITWKNSIYDIDEIKKYIRTNNYFKSLVIDKE